MTRLQNLNAYLTERLMVAARDILEVVGNTISEYQKETARTIKENEELRRRLREIGVQANLEFFDSGHPVAPPVSIGSAPQSPQPHKPQCNSGLEEDREPPQTDIKQEFLEQHESKPEQGAVDLNKQASALTCAENPSEHRILQPSLPFEEKTEEVGCLPLMLPDQIKSELDELDYNIQKQSIASQPLNRVNNNSNTAESKNCAERKWMDRGGVMAEPNEQDSSREVCDIPVGGGSQHLPCTSLRAEKGDKPTITSKAAQSEVSDEHAGVPDRVPTSPSVFTGRRAPNSSKTSGMTPGRMTRIVTKDVICLPNNTPSHGGKWKVPRGRDREILGMKGLISKMHINSTWSSERVTSEMNTLFQDALGQKEEIKFTFLERVPGARFLAMPRRSSDFSWNGSEVLYLSGRGALYVLSESISPNEKVALSDINNEHTLPMKRRRGTVDEEDAC
ncbi:uncharacterized protein LOC125748000 isoform X10 [Brienomyrus brachyistius]|uniref:uncharacterized protein LOC125748000 isoform X10 n=1 Tax=Brienomyrus brachyistius TaxID=42636 RepID=UPI0020B43A67|nr:uncharacterized protein LOC125748000 isoform X10 [Brienomyrus brachyistius]